MAGVDLHLAALEAGRGRTPTTGPTPPSSSPAPTPWAATGRSPTRLHATAWAHQHIAGLDPRRHTVIAQPVAAPFDMTGQAPPDPPVDPPAPGCHLVVLAEPRARGAVGFFPDAAAARAWADSQRPAVIDVTFTVLPVADPATVPGTGADLATT